MALDEFGSQPVALEAPSKPFDDFGSVPMPKMPDTSDVQKMAQDNLAANDNEGKSPIQKLDTAVGEPVSSWVKGGNKDTPLTPATREHYVKSVQAGTASNFGDFMQSTLHAVTPIVAGVQRAMHPLDFVKEMGEDVVSAAKGGAGQIMYPFLSEENKQELLKNSQLTDYKDPENPTGPEIEKRGIELEQATYGKGMGGLFAPAAALSPLISPIIESTGGKPLKPGEAPTYQSNIPGLIGVGMDVLGTLGVVHGVGELKAAREARETSIDRSNPPSLTGRPIDVNFPNAGPWDGPGHEAVKQPIADVAKKPANAVTSPEVDQAIMTATKDKAPPASDFKDVAIVTGANEKTLQVIFKQTGVSPEEVFDQAHKDSAVLDDIRNGDVPENFPVEPTSAAAPERLDVAEDKSTSTFNVVDRDGDHVRGGFDSAEEARQYIDDKIQSEAIEKQVEDVENGKSEPKQDVLTPESAKAVTEPKPVENMYSGIDKKIEGMTPEQRNLRLESLNKKMEAGIITPKELGEREALSAKAQEAPTKSSFNHRPIEREIPADNYSKSLKEYSPIMYRETSVNGALELLPHGGVATDVGELHLADTTDMATGQGKNKGVMIAFDTDGLKGQRNRTKPTADMSYSQGFGEYYGKYNTQSDYQKSVSAVQVSKDAAMSKTEKAMLSRTLKTLEEKGWTKTETDKYTEYTKPEEEQSSAAQRMNALWKNQEGSGAPDALRQMMSEAIKSTEKLAGKLTGDFFEKLGQAYIRTFQPELVSDKSLRADAFLAKNKAKIQEMENAFYHASEVEIKRWDKATLDQQKEWLYDHETGRWNEEENPDHARMAAIYDVMRKTEQDAGVGNQAYKENYLPHQYENPDAVKAFFNSAGMIKKYGRDWFNKASEFKLIQDADRAGFKLKTYNPERMLLDRRQASYNLIAQMDLLKDFEGSGLAVKTSTFSLDKKIAKTQTALTDLETKLKEVSAKVEDPRQEKWDFANPLVTNLMQTMAERVEALKNRLEGFTKEKTDNKMTPEQMGDLKNGFKIIGPDSRAWSIHGDVAPIWKNAMEMKGLYENQDLAGSAYRTYMAGKAIYVRQKMMASLFHPTHEVVIDISSDLASATHHLIQGGKISDLVDKNMIPSIGLGKYTAKLQDNPQVTSWNTAPDLRTPEQQAHVDRMVEGGFVPTVPKQDSVSFKENFNKAISGLGKQNLRLIGTAMEIPGLPMAPLMEHWIPGMKTESYFQRTDLALARDPSLANDAGKRSEAFRKIAQDIERNYGEMNRKTQFWNPIVRDIFNATTFSGGWKLAMLQNFRGLAEPARIVYNWAKTGEFSKAQITHQMLQSYIYTANMMMLGAGLNYLFTGSVGTIKDWINPQTGDKNPDGTPVRLRQPAFFNEPIQLMHDIYSDGVVPGTGTFFYHQTLIPGIADSLLGRDFVGRPYITDPTDLHQWMNMGMESISPIALSNAERAEQKDSETAKVMGWVGFPVAGAYINQTPFEQKIIGAYHALHPSEGGAYQSKLSSEMRGAVASHDYKAEQDIEKEMKHEQMTDTQISNAKAQHKTPYPEFIWSKLSKQNQERLIESASPEEKVKFKVKGE